MKKYAILYFGLFLYTISNLAHANGYSGSFYNATNESIYVVQLDANKGGGNLEIYGSNKHICEIESANESCALSPNESYAVQWTETSGHTSSYDCLGFLHNTLDPTSSLFSPGLFGKYGDECDNPVGSVAMALHANGQEIGFNSSLTPMLDYNTNMKYRDGVSIDYDREHPNSIVFYNY